MVPRRDCKTRLTKSSSRRTLEGTEIMSRDIGEGKVGKGEFINPETGSTCRFISRMDSLPEKRQLKSILMPLLIN